MRYIDLTYAIHNEMFKYPSDVNPEIEIKRAKIEEVDKIILDESGASSGAGFSDKKYKSGNTTMTHTSHHGTHIDAPAHKIKGGKTIDKYLIPKFVNDAVLVDLSSTGLLNRERRGISVEDIQSFDFEKYPGIGALIFYTGFCDEMKEREGKLKGEAKKDFEKTFPYFTPEAAAHVVSNVPFLNIVGIDSFAFDPSGSNSESHRAFFEKDILPLETLVNLGELKEKNSEGIFKLFCAPLIYAGADAAQTRAYGFVEGGVKI